MLSMQLFFLWSLYIVFSVAMIWYLYTNVGPFLCYVYVIYIWCFYCHSFCVTYSIIVYNNNMMLCLWYWHVIFNFCLIRRINILATCMFYIVCHSYKVHSITTILLHIYLINVLECCSIQHNLYLIWTFLNLISCKVDPWLFHLPLTKETKSNTHPYSSYNICHLAITPANCCKQWLFHLPLGNQHLSKVVLTPTTTSANNINIDKWDHYIIYGNIWSALWQ